MTNFIPGNIYLLHREDMNGKVIDHYRAIFHGYKSEHNGQIKLALFYDEMDGQETCIDIDFINNWQISQSEYTY